MVGTAFEKMREVGGCDDAGDSDGGNDDSDDDDGSGDDD